MNIINELQERGILQNCTDVKNVINAKNSGVYVGFDPTAPSLHLGNYIQIITLLRFKQLGYSVYYVMGGATAMIGDPSGKNNERKLLNENKIILFKEKIQKQLESFGIEVIDNLKFYEKMSLIDFLRKVGKLLNVNYMISKEVVKNRLSIGISFTEFSYQLIQAWDFLQLYKNNNVKIQVGGSDQWGNITSGLEVIRKVTNNKNHDAAGVTTKLLVNSHNEKFGKTSSNTNIWLDPNLTSPFALYQFLLNLPDNDIKKMLKWLTFLPIEKIEKIMIQHNKKPNLKIAQTLLAEEVTQHIHGTAQLKSSKRISHFLFNKSENVALTDQDYQQLKCAIPYHEGKEMNIIDFLIIVKLCKSKREAKELIKNGAIRINNCKITDSLFTIGGNQKFTIIKCGKRKNTMFISKNK